LLGLYQWRRPLLLRAKLVIVSYSLFIGDSCGSSSL
jgi:hypothetical protein